MKEFVRTAVYVVGAILALLIVLTLLRGLIRMLIVAVMLAVPIMIIWAIWRYVVRKGNPKEKKIPEVVVVETPPTVNDPRARRVLDKVDQRLAELDRRMPDSN